MALNVPILGFVSILFVAFFLIHYYIYLKIENVYPAYSKPGFVVAFFMSLLFPITTLLVRNYYNRFLDSVYFFAAVWVGFLFFLMIGFALRDVVSLFLSHDLYLSFNAVVLLALIVSSYALFNGMNFSVTNVEVPLKGLGHEIRAVQISDVHVGALRDANYLQRVVDATNSLNPDVVFITGDLFDGSKPIDDDSLKALSSFKGKTFFVIGNHEIYEGVPYVEEKIANTDVVILRDEAVYYDGLRIVGADFPVANYLGNNAYLGNIPLDESVPTVLLYHPPTGTDLSSARGVDLQLSGHTHGGQVFPFTLLGKLFYPKYNGLYDAGNGMKIFVSSGTGTWGPPMRLGSANEIVLLRLVPE